MNKNLLTTLSGVFTGVGIVLNDLLSSGSSLSVCHIITAVGVALLGIFAKDKGN